MQTQASGATLWDNSTHSNVPCPVPVIHNISDLQRPYPDRFNGIGKFEAEYHIFIDPAVLTVVHAPPKCPIHIKDNIKRNLMKWLILVWLN